QAHCEAQCDLVISIVHPSLLVTLPGVILSFLFNGPTDTKIYTLSLHDALPISGTTAGRSTPATGGGSSGGRRVRRRRRRSRRTRSEEHTSELQSRSDLVCRLLLEKKKEFTGALLQFVLGVVMSVTVCLVFFLIY